MTWRSAPPSCGGIFDYDHKRERLTLLDKELEDAKIWDDPQHAQDLGRELFEMSREEGDDATPHAVEADAAAASRPLRRDYLAGAPRNSAKRLANSIDHLSKAFFAYDHCWNEFM
jgi:hypothetical protein